MLRVLRVLIGIVILAGLGVLLWFATRPPPLIVQGEVSANRVDISPRVSGRVAKLNADVGDNVERGAVIAELESPQLIAALHMSEAALSVAEADLVRVNSTRPETIAARKAELAAAAADVTLYQEESDRQAKLITTGASTQSRVDETTRNLESAIRKRESAEADLQLAVAGASKEEKALAATQVEQSKASLNQQQTDVHELTIVAPISGQVTTRVAELGENFSAGAPIFSLIDIQNPWFTFNLREDLLKGLKIGDSFDVTVPALGDSKIAVKVTTINAQGQYATWRATRATGDFDLRTFEVRANPVQPIQGLRPGMSVIASWPPAGIEMMGKGRLRPGFLTVFRREFDRFSRRPFLLFLTTILPLLLMGVLAAVFSAGLATRLPIAVLDQDNTDLSRTIIRTVDATPDTAVVRNVSDLTEGRQLILSGAVHGLLMLPQHLERDVLSGRRPEVVFFYNTQTMTTGNLTLRGVSAAVPAVAAGIRLSLRTAQGQPVDAAQEALAPIPVQVNPLFNPTLNYAHFLLAALLPSVLQVIIVTTMAYAVGLDVETTHRLRILRRLGGGLWPAMAGKILPYTLLFLVVLGIADWVLFGVLGMPLRGDRYLLLLSGILFVLADQFIGVLLALLLRPMASAISIGTLLMAPAFGFMGIGFPRIGMNTFAYYWGQIIPGTWYLMARIDQTIRGTPLYLSWKPIAVLLFMVLLLASLTALRLEVIRARRERHKEQAIATSGAAG